MKKFVIAVIMLAWLPAAAQAQHGNDPFINQPGVKSDAQKKIDADIDKAYHDTMKKTGGGQPSAKGDPWGTLRPAASDNTKK